VSNRLGRRSIEPGGRVRTSIIAIAITLLTGASAAVAQDDQPTCREVRPGFVQCTGTTIEGRQPQSWVLLGRSRDRWEPRPLRRRDAARDVVRTVRRAPF
jgi:hypothetical protein